MYNVDNKYSVLLVRNKDISIFIHADTKAANVILGIIKELCLVKISESKIVHIDRSIIQQSYFNVYPTEVSPSSFCSIEPKVWKI